MALTDGFIPSIDRYYGGFRNTIPSTSYSPRIDYGFLQRPSSYGFVPRPTNTPYTDSVLNYIANRPITSSQNLSQNRPTSRRTVDYTLPAIDLYSSHDDAPGIDDVPTGIDDQLGPEGWIYAPELQEIAGKAIVGKLISFLAPAPFGSIFSLGMKGLDFIDTKSKLNEIAKIVGREPLTTTEIIEFMSGKQAFEEDEIEDYVTSYEVGKGAEGPFHGIPFLAGEEPSKGVKEPQTFWDKFLSFFTDPEPEPEELPPFLTEQDPFVLVHGTKNVPPPAPPPPQPFEPDLDPEEPFEPGAFHASGPMHGVPELAGEWGSSHGLTMGTEPPNPPDYGELDTVDPFGSGVPSFAGDPMEFGGLSDPLGDDGGDEGDTGGDPDDPGGADGPG